ncbi:MAG: glycosyltransferase [Bacteroidales bacterium]|nr:glycosyltransferase [Bacteroidales bacterium]
MRIFVIANGYPTDREPQFGCFEKDQALELVNQGHEVTLLYVDGRFRKYRRKPGITHKVENNINIYGIYWLPIVFIRIFSYKLAHKFRSFLLDLLFRHALRRQEKPDVIYAHYCYNIANAAGISRNYGIPLVGIEHWSLINQDILPAKVRYLGNIAYANADSLIAVSDALARSISTKFGYEAKVINDMVGKEFISEDIAEPANQRFRFIAIGSLIPRKGFDKLIEAFNETGLYKKNCELIIIGSGPESDNLKMLINTNKLNNFVNLAGRRTKHEIIGYLKESNAFVLSSDVETFGVVCIEAMALGVPVIATACGGPEEFINEGNGILVKNNDVRELAEAMIRMYEKRSDFDRKAIADECKIKFAPDVIAGQLVQVFEQTISKCSGK